MVKKQASAGQGKTIFKDCNIMVGGEAGQGIQSVGQILAKVWLRSGFYVFADQDYESRVRGGHNFFRIRFCDTEIQTFSEKLDILVAMNSETIDLHRDELKSDGMVIFDGDNIDKKENEKRYLNIPLTRLAEEATHNKLAANTVAAGAAVALAGGQFDLLSDVLKTQFAESSGSIVEDNIEAAKAGFDFARDNADRIFERNGDLADGSPPKILVNGNEALALGAMAAGCKFMAGYPMTPATSIMEYFADKGRQFNIVTIHVEDEISAINMAIGAGFAGVRAMTATSGGGFALMVEGLSLAGMTETPVVIVVAQRPGPATGLPTRTEQGDLEFILHAGHGEFPVVVLAPSTVQEAFEITIRAFNLAEVYQGPVFILTDHHLASSYNTFNKPDLSKVKIDRGELVSSNKAGSLTGYKRHQLTESGISPRAIPMDGEILVVTDSDEHDEAGHMIEDGKTRIEQNSKRLRKLNGLRTSLARPRIKEVPGAQFSLIGWGSTYGAINEAAKLLNNEGIAVSQLHISEIWPFPSEDVSNFTKTPSKCIVIENNATGQMARLIRRETGKLADGVILKYDGRPISAQYIVDQLIREDYKFWST